ncbi:MAG: hypothetical protein U5J62_08880 [Desulfurivibrio sp.]|nr:hypothetical protein [Desulfurivibrio sp.]
MPQLTMQMPEGVLATVHQEPVEFAREMRIAAAVNKKSPRSRAESD